jgi:hypothetical protein
VVQRVIGFCQLDDGLSVAADGNSIHHLLAFPDRFIIGYLFYWLVIHPCVVDSAAWRDRWVTLDPSLVAGCRRLGPTIRPCPAEES